jgi:predicted PurR-regulated permease PerM
MTIETPAETRAPADEMAHGLSIADRLSLPQIRWGWLLLIAGFIGLFWMSRSVIGPFVAGFVVAYLLDPPAQILERRGWPRWLASALVLTLFIVALASVVLASAPIIQTEVQQLITTIPTLIQTSLPVVERLLHNSPFEASSREALSGLGTRVVGWLSESVGAIIAGSLAFVNVVTFIVVTPIVAFYLLRDWPVILERLNSFWPRRQLPVIKALMAQSDAALSGFVRGQSLVCLILAGFYAVGWGVVGLDYAIVLGLLAGVLGFVPFLGVLVAVGLSLLVALGQYGLDPLHLGLVLVVFVVGQVLESSVLTPNLIGNRIGLHPVWVLFAVFAGGQVAGLAGVFLAVPLAAVLGVIARWAAEHYRRSDFYGAGRAGPVPASTPPA